jgi:hypothetical protein
MPAICGLNNRGIPIVIQIDGQNVTIPAGKFRIKNENGVYVAVTPTSGRYDKIGQDLGQVSFQTNTLTFSSAIPSIINVGEFNRIFGEGLDSFDLLVQGLNMCSNLYEAIPGGCYGQSFASAWWAFGGISVSTNQASEVLYSLIYNGEAIKAVFGDSMSRFRILSLVYYFWNTGKFAGYFGDDVAVGVVGEKGSIVTEQNKNLVLMNNSGEFSIITNEQSIASQTQFNNYIEQNVEISSPAQDGNITPLGVVEVDDYTGSSASATSATLGFVAKIAVKTAQEKAEAAAAPPVATIPIMEIKRGTTSISNLGTDTVVSTVAGSTTNLIYEIKNTGTATLTLSGSPSVAISPPSNCTVNVISLPPTNSSITQGSTITFDINVTPILAGPWSFIVSIVNDSATTPYIYTVSGSATGTPIMDIVRVTSIANGANDTVTGTSFGSSTLLLYTINNTGTEVLNIISPIIPNNENNCMLTTTQPLDFTINPSGNTSFDINVTPIASGPWSFEVSIVNVSSTNPYAYTVSGNAL